jgi:hypothetical protein
MTDLAITNKCQLCAPADESRVKGCGGQRRDRLDGRMPSVDESRRAANKSDCSCRENEKPERQLITSWKALARIVSREYA